MNKLGSLDLALKTKTFLKFSIKITLRGCWIFTGSEIFKIWFPGMDEGANRQSLMSDFFKIYLQEYFPALIWLFCKQILSLLKIRTHIS
jgi:hypothetical protein